ncbi:hypothetical protein GQ457_10G006500 [Hibiscus cannabinus]
MAYRYPITRIDTQVFQTPNAHIDAGNIPIRSEDNTGTRRKAYRYPFVRTDTETPRSQRLVTVILPYRCARTRTDTLCTRSAYLTAKSISTVPKHLQRSPTARNSIGSIKDTSKHQGKANASIYNNIMIKNLS